MHLYIQFLSGPLSLSDHCHVLDHSHLTGKFRGAHHNVCNLNFQFTGRNPVIFRNLRNYNSHLTMLVAGKLKNKPIKCIPNNMERYISFLIDHLGFLNCLQFIPECAIRNACIESGKGGRFCKFPFFQAGVASRKAKCLEEGSLPV